MSKLDLTDIEVSELYAMIMYYESYHGYPDGVRGNIIEKVRTLYKEEFLDDKESEPKNIIVTRREVVQNDVLLDELGLNPYCINEGADPDYEYRITKTLAKNAGII